LDKTAILFPDKLFLELKFRLMMGQKLDLKNPKTFNEKLQWLKLYNRKPEYTTMVDKYAVKQYVADKIGEEYIIPTLGVWDKPEDIDWDFLPNQFVLKTTHGGGGCGVVICKDKSTFDITNAIKQLKKSLKQDIFLSLREWPYKNVPKRIIAETYIKSSLQQSCSEDLTDYKFFCFDGYPKYCQVIRDRRSMETIDFYDMEWNHMPFIGINPVYGNGFRNGIHPVHKPEYLMEMINVCKIISKDTSFSRIDLYFIDNKIYFGEITFFPAGGIGKFTPDIWDYKLGDLLVLR